MLRRRLLQLGTYFSGSLRRGPRYAGPTPASLVVVLGTGINQLPLSTFTQSLREPLRVRREGELLSFLGILETRTRQHEVAIRRQRELMHAAARAELQPVAALSNEVYASISNIKQGAVLREGSHAQQRWDITVADLGRLI